MERGSVLVMMQIVRKIWWCPSTVTNKSNSPILSTNPSNPNTESRTNTTSTASKPSTWTPRCSLRQTPWTSVSTLIIIFQCRKSNLWKGNSRWVLEKLGSSSLEMREKGSKIVLKRGQICRVWLARLWAHSRSMCQRLVLMTRSQGVRCLRVACHSLFKPKAQLQAYTTNSHKFLSHKFTTQNPMKTCPVNTKRSNNTFKCKLTYRNCRIKSKAWKQSWTLTGDLVPMLSRQKLSRIVTFWRKKIST